MTALASEPKRRRRSKSRRREQFNVTLDRVARNLRELAARPGAAIGETVAIQSWMGIFRANVTVDRPKDVNELAACMRKGEGYNCIGASHSYNGIQVVERSHALIFKGAGFTHIDIDADHIVTVGASVTIRELKEYLRDKGRRLISSGNYMAQTVVGALLTGTHGYGERAVMAEGIVRLRFVDGRGRVQELKRGDPDFPLAALSFGVIAPIIEVSLETARLESFQSDARVCRLSRRKEFAEGALAVSFAVLPYSDDNDPTIMIHTLRLPDSSAGEPPRATSKNKWLTPIVEFIVRRYQAFDILHPAFRVRMQKFVHDLDLCLHQRTFTDPDDLDYLYDPEPLLATERTPDLVRSMFSTTETAYNLAFFVPIDRVDDVVKFLIYEAKQLSSLNFYLKSLIGVRELTGRSGLPFAATYNGPVAAIDLFADLRDYAWLERLQRRVLDYFPGVRPHWGKSAIMPEFLQPLGARHINDLRRLHEKHYPDRQVRARQEIRRLVGFDTVVPGTSALAAPIQQST